MIKASVVFFSGNIKGKLYSKLSQYFAVERDQLFLFGAGRMALYTFLKSLDLKKPDEVIVIGYTCVVVPNAAQYLDLNISYVDIDESTLNISTEKVSAKVNSNTKVLIIAHNFGLPYNDILSLRSKFPELIIIEDAAHTFGSIDEKGNMLGTIGHASFFSFEFSKPLTSGMGGLLIVNDKKLIESVNELHSKLKPWSIPDRFRIMKSLAVQYITANSLLFPLRGLFVRILNAFNLSYTSSEAELRGELPKNYPVSMTNYQASLLYHQLNEIESINKEKADITRKYQHAFKNFKSVRQYYVDKTVYVRYPLLINDELGTVRVEELKNDIQTVIKNPGSWFDDVIYPKGSNRCGYVEEMCPVGESVARRIVNLPVGIHNPISDKKIKELVSVFKKYEF
ncbi:MAG: hypothetical protein HKN22_05650 [Bacteroidia bacterium]|nr:hypothetical protein [Bacteroidia bacterium]